MRCIDCSNLVSRNAAMTRNGYSGCKHHPEWEFRATTKERECEQFVQVTPEIAQTRCEWAAKTNS